MLNDLAAVNTLLAADGTIVENDEISLVLAASQGQLELVNILLKAGMPVDQQADIHEGCPALHRAIQFGHNDMAKALINAGALLALPRGFDGPCRYWKEYSDMDIITPLYQAIVSNNREIAKFLIDTGVDINATVMTIQELDEERTALQTAVFCENITLVQDFIAAGANLDHESSFYNYTALNIALSLGNKEIVETLLAAGANVHQLEDQYTLLYSAHNSHPTSPLLIEMLQQRGVKYNLFDAMFLQRNDLLKLALAETPNVDDVTVAELLYDAIEFQNVEILDTLLKAGLNVDLDNTLYQAHRATNPSSIIISMLKQAGAQYSITDAIRLNRFDILQEVIKAGADVNHVVQGNSPLNCAIRHGDKDMVELLIKTGADLTHRSSLYGGRNPLELAVKDNKIEIVDILIKAGVDVNSIHQDLTPPLFTAIIGHKERNSVELVKFLIKAGTDINAHNNHENFSPLHSAAAKINVDIIKALIEAGANINALDKYNRSPLYYAQQAEGKHAKEIIELLIKSGAVA
jgi:ankyrin repeat protein